MDLSRVETRNIHRIIIRLSDVSNKTAKDGPNDTAHILCRLLFQKPLVTGQTIANFAKENGSVRPDLVRRHQKAAKELGLEVNNDKKVIETKNLKSRDNFDGWLSTSCPEKTKSSRKDGEGRVGGPPARLTFHRKESQKMALLLLPKEFKHLIFQTLKCSLLIILFTLIDNIFFVFKLKEMKAGCD